MSEPVTTFIETTPAVDGIGYVEICRPEKKNALNTPMGDDIIAALRSLEADPDCKAIILCGRGGDLSSGADLSEQRDPNVPHEPWTNAPHARMLRTVATARIPVIAAIDGWAIGMGLGLVGAATHVVAGSGSRFMLPEVKSDYLAFAVLPHLTYRVRPETIFEWTLSGAIFTVDDAVAAGLVTHRADAGEAKAVAAELAAKVTIAPRAVIEQGMDFVRECRALGGASTIVGWCEKQMDALFE